MRLDYALAVVHLSVERTCQEVHICFRDAWPGWQLHDFTWLGLDRSGHVGDRFEFVRDFRMIGRKFNVFWCGLMSYFSADWSELWLWHISNNNRLDDYIISCRFLVFELGCIHLKRVQRELLTACFSRLTSDYRALRKRLTKI